MPLSEQEQRLLDEMERSLYHSEADDVTTVGAPRGRASVTAIAIGAVAVILGIGLLLTGVISRLPIVGVLGFAVMVGGALFAIAPPLRFRVLASGHRASGRGGSRPGFMDSLNERWERRSDDRDR